MALMVCPECGKMISDIAISCPNCGCPSAVWQAKTEKKLLPIFAGTTFEFGKYPYGLAGEIKPIQWKVLALCPKLQIAILISEYIIEAKPFNNEFIEVNWKNSSLCQWMNGAFLSEAFSTSEKEVMLNPFNSMDRTSRVFLPTKEDVDNFLKNAERECKVTPYARKRGVSVDISTGMGSWWLNQVHNKYAMIINSAGVCGGIDYAPVQFGDIGVRPEIIISYIPEEDEQGEMFGSMGFVKISESNMKE